MANFLSPGVFIQEIDASTVVSGTSDSVAVFGGNFQKGPVGSSILISTVQELKEHFGLPNKTNFNEWYQCYNFLQYGDTLYVARAGDIDGTKTKLEYPVKSKSFVTENKKEQVNLEIKQLNGVILTVAKTDLIKVDDVLTFDNVVTEYTVTYVADDVINENGEDVEVTNISLSAMPVIDTNLVVYKIVANTTDTEFKQISFEGSIPFKVNDILTDSEEPDAKEFKIISVENIIKDNKVYTNVGYKCLENPDLELNANEGDFIFTITKLSSACEEFSSREYSDINVDDENHLVANYAVFDDIKDSLKFIKADSKLKVFAKSPGSWGNDIQVAIANFEDFNNGKNVFDGISLDALFEFIPTKNQFAIIVKLGEEVVEKFIVSFDELAKDDSNNSLFVENVVNQKSNYILVSVNEANPDNTILSYLNENAKFLKEGFDSEAGFDDIIEAYNLFDNKEEIDIDIVIGNEKYPEAAANLAMAREDCIAFIGCPKDCSLGLKSSVATQKSVDYRRELNINNSFVALFSNYKYQYCAEMDSYKWLNLSGDIAGLKAKTNQDRYTWFAAAGLERGQIKGAKKLAVSFTNAQRDTLYKNNINPIVTFPNQGTVLWGQKTMLDKSSAFNRINIRALFNYLERSLGKMSKYSLFESNDSFLRNYLTSIIKPFLTGVKAGRGIADYLVICDDSNNTSQVVANNQLIIDIYIKPVYATEFILLRFINSGVNEFSTTIVG